MKAKGKDGSYYNGSAGKGFGYGAQEGSLYVQGNADARAGIRLSGADMIIGGRITKAIPAQEHGNIGVHSNIKGFAFEYMTNGRGLVFRRPRSMDLRRYDGRSRILTSPARNGINRSCDPPPHCQGGASVTVQTLSSKRCSGCNRNADRLYPYP
ncbi:hypothetical protein GCM10020331_088990 [Ectobacillus funiculus]